MWLLAREFFNPTAAFRRQSDKRRSRFENPRPSPTILAMLPENPELLPTAPPQRAAPLSIYDGPWEKRLEIIVETMREMSRQTDPQLMVQAYGRRMRQMLGYDRMVALSRRNTPAGRYRITRSTTWTEQINRWQSPELRPVLQGGLLGELIQSEQP